MRLLMQTEFRAIVHSEYGAPEKILKIAKRQLNSEELGADDVLVKVIARPIHPGDIQILSALPQGGPVEPIPEGTLRVPGFEGVGTIVRLGTNAKAAKRFSEGQRVAFFPAKGTWGEYVVVRHNCLLPVPDEISDHIAAQMLINTITASVLIKAGHNWLKAPITLPVYILQNAAASGVGRLLTQVALDRGVRPIRLVRSNQSAERLRSALSGPPVYSTAIAIGNNRYAKPWVDTSSTSLSMPWVGKRSTISRSLLITFEVSSPSVHCSTIYARTSIRLLPINSLFSAFRS